MCESRAHGEESGGKLRISLFTKHPRARCFIPDPMMKFLKGIYNKYLSENRVILCAPEVPGKHALVFCTYAGGHTGVDEAVPAVKYASQIFAHYGIRVVDEWYVVGGSSWESRW